MPKAYKRVKNLNRNPLLFEIIALVFIGLLCLSLIFATYMVIITSLKGIVDYTINPIGIPKKLRFDNYANAMEQLYVRIPTETGTRNVEFLELFINSLIFMFGCGFVQLYAQFTCAYVATKYPCFITNLMTWIVVFVISFPIVGSTASSMVLYRTVGIYNNRIFYILCGATFTGTGFLIYRSACKGIDDAYLDAARLDGAGHYRVMFTIVVPMVKPLLIGMFLIDVLALWKDWSTPMIWLPKYPTIAYALYRFQFSTENSVSQVPAQMAGCVLVMLPNLILFLLFKDKFIGNISFGGLKG